MTLKRILSFACVLALLAGPLMVGNAYAQNNCPGDGGNHECEGGATCKISTEDFDAELATELGLSWTVDSNTGTVIISLIDYKELQNALFCSELDDPSNTDILLRSRIVVTSVDGQNQFPANICVYVFLKLRHCGDIYLAANADGDTSDPQPIVLCGTGTIDQFPPAPGAITEYVVQGDVLFINQSDPTKFILVKAGSTVDMES